MVRKPWASTKRDDRSWRQRVQEGFDVEADGDGLVVASAVLVGSDCCGVEGGNAGSRASHLPASSFHMRMDQVVRVGGGLGRRWRSG